MKWTRKNAIVTGGAGFIGSALVDRLLELGADVTVVDKLQLTTGSLSWNRKLERLQRIFAKHGMRRSMLEICDLETERHKFQHIAQSADVMFHLSAVFGGREFVDTRQSDCSKMLSIDHNAIEAAYEAGVGRFHYSSSACFPAGTKVWTPIGKKNIEEISPGERVLDHLGRAGEVKEVMSRRHSGQIAKIWISGFSRSIDATPEHPFLIEQGGEVRWAKAEELLVGSRVLVPVVQPSGTNQVIDLTLAADTREKAYVELQEMGATTWGTAVAFLSKRGVRDPGVRAVTWTRYGERPPRLRSVERVILKIDVDNEVAWLLGAYLAEGWTESHGRSPSQIVFGIGDEPAFEARIIDIASKKFGLRLRRIALKKQRGAKLEGTHPLLAEWLTDNIGTGARRKRVPAVIMNGTLDVVRSFLRGYLEGDGCKSIRRDGRRPRVTWGTVSTQLSDGVQVLVARLGISPGYAIRAPSKTVLGRSVSAVESIQSYVDGWQAVELLGQLGLDQSQATNTQKYQRTRRIKSDEGSWVSRLVAKVEKVPFDSMVYNLEVRPNHSYCVGDGVAVHNCVYPDSLQEDPNYLLKEDDILSTGDGWKSSDNLYGFAKLMGELQCKVFHDEKGLKTSTCRYLTVYGPGEFDTSHAISALIEKALDKLDPYVVWGSGRQERGFTYVTDIVEGSILACEKITDGTPVNLGWDKRYKIKEVAEMILEITGHKAKMLFDRSKPEGPFSRALDIQRAKKLLQWEPAVDLREGLEKTVAWHQGQRKSVAATAKTRRNR